MTGSPFGIVPSGTTLREVNGKAYISEADNDGDGYWAEDVSCRVQFERTDGDEIRIGVMLPGEDQEAAGVYLRRSEAIRALLALAQSIGEV